MSEALARRISVVSLVFLVAASSFIYGAAVMKYKIWPHSTIRGVSDAVKSLREFGELVPEGRRVRAPEGASRQAFTVHEPDGILDGYYAFAGWDSDNGVYAAWLYDNEGQRLHTWLVDYYSLDPDGPSNGGDSPHAFYMLADGSIILGWDGGDVMVRLDACMRPIWTKSGIFHHAVSRAEDGSFWTWRAEGTAYGHYHYMHNFDAETGEPLREVGLVEDVIAAMGPTSQVFGVRPDHEFEAMDRDPADRRSIMTPDIFHPNDVEALQSDMAPLFPMFEAGDLLLSFRNIDLVTVLDPDDGRVKWWSNGPWIGQHDPDFTADGKISVYSNNTGRGRSEIIKIDPATKTISNELFGGKVSFGSAFKGKHQYLPNGNVLIVVPAEGRVLEVTSKGANVMEFNNLSSVSADYNEHVFNAVWVDPAYFSTIPQCEKSTS